MSSIVSIKHEDGTEYAQFFYTEDARDGGQKDERWKSEKLKSTELYTTTKYWCVQSFSLYFSPWQKSWYLKHGFFKKCLTFHEDLNSDVLPLHTCHALAILLYVV